MVEKLIKQIKKWNSLSYVPKINRENEQITHWSPVEQSRKNQNPEKHREGRDIVAPKAWARLKSTGTSYLG